MRGTVLFFDPGRGYGLVEEADSAAVVLVQLRDVERAGLKGLAAGQQLEFELTRDRRRGVLHACKLRMPPA